MINKTLRCHKLMIRHNQTHMKDTYKIIIWKAQEVLQADITEAFYSTFIYLDDLHNSDNPYFEGMVNQIYPPELQLHKANIPDTDAPFY